MTSDNCGFDLVDFWHEDRRRARVKHWCYECQETIEPGEDYVMVSMMYERKWEHCPVCEYCWIDWQQLVEIGYCICLGGLSETLEWVYE